MKAIDKSEKLYFEHFLPRLKKEYPECVGKYAAGLIGHGSECFGYDDEISLDHDVSNGFYIWLTEENDIKYGVKLSRVYRNIFAEYGESYGAESGAVKRGVITIPEFLSSNIGSKRLPEAPAEWLNIPLYALANITNGKIFEDGEGEFTAIVKHLKNMPSDTRLKRISASSALAAQSGQYNFMRAVKHSEIAAASIALYEFADNISEIVFLLNRKYPPYYKWLFRAMRELPILGDKADALEYLICEETSLKTVSLKSEIIEDISKCIIEELARQNISNAKSEFLEPHAYSVAEKINDCELRSMHIMQK